MTENNGQEPEAKKPKVQVALTRDDEHSMNLPHWLLEEPERWVDGQRFILKRRLGNAWELVLQDEPEENYVDRMNRLAQQSRG